MNEVRCVRNLRDPGVPSPSKSSEDEARHQILMERAKRKSSTSQLGMQRPGIGKQGPLPCFYRYMMAFIFAVDEINNNPNILPNITLGYHATDYCNNANNAIDHTLQILSGPTTTVPNYCCNNHGKLVGFIGNHFTKTSFCIVDMINLYGYTQISFGATDSLFSNKQIYPSFFQTLPSDQTQYLAISKLLKHFSWTWIGVIASDDESGEKQTQELRKVTEALDICIEFIIRLKPDELTKEISLEKSKNTFMSSTSRIVVCSGTVSFSTMYFMELECDEGREKTFIVPASSVIHVILSAEAISSFLGSLVFSPPTKKIPHLKAFLQNISFETRPNDTLLEQILASYFKCSTSHPSLNDLLESYFNIKLHTCKRIIRLGELGRQVYNTDAFGTTYQVYKAVYAIAHALHEMQIYFSKNPNDSYGNNPKQMHKFLRRVRFQDPTGENVYFNEKGEMDAVYDIHNYASVSGKKIVFQKIGRFNASAQEREQLIIGEGGMHWKHGVAPISRCSPDCPSGYRKVFRRGKHKCCFACVQCSEGEISNHTDKGSCQKCQEDQWPNDNDQCEQKIIEYLSYRNDPIALTVSIISTFCFVKTAVILVMFFRYPISCILAKTLQVYMAFKATKPGSVWKHIIGPKMTNCVVFIFSFIPILCNVGSILAFSILLGYMGLLAAVSFIIAFLARNLPDSFNEAKNITFSMLVVCSVWVAFIPAYMGVPVSKCSEDCPAGYQSILTKGIHTCCFECMPCAEGEISNETGKNIDRCIQCPGDQWPNDRNQCVPKAVEYLSYIDDPITLMISVITLFLFVNNSLILGIFIVFRDTPVVKATNQSLSFILLVSIMFSFLCVLLFLGRPIHATCMLRQTSFGIIFSVAISSILAKTIMVYVAFKATKPGSEWRKFIGVKITNCLVFICSFIQVVISIIWLWIAPPFPEKNSDLYVNKILLQCNEGSMLAFSILLGYMGFLTVVSFLVAYLVRNLPDSFNEAKNITFSMLVFCSVWVAFIPAYMSVTGKNTVLVEIFAILSSSVGILACIFFPKCYIIIMRPSCNSKKILFKHT
ncbi:vomeronasal type-2 receptor 26-like [Rhinoderma darwinii]|uniref:vomeronasal type-2 receptor 26-like n=1 Tax=Rhinoderma darwinii TaxID=43563 RepID=UPI003F66EDC4